MPPILRNTLLNVCLGLEEHPEPIPLEEER